MTFADSSGWFALFVPVGPDHQAAVVWYSTYTGPLLTTDYVVDETLTLMRARGQHQKALEFGRDVFGGKLATIHYLNRAEIADAWDVFQRFRDKDWSFTDCTSKVVIEALGIAQAFAFDQHFRQFGSVAVAP
jgi:predicted nucleic acid-binding protein